MQESPKALRRELRRLSATGRGGKRKCPARGPLRPLLALVPVKTLRARVGSRRQCPSLGVWKVPPSPQCLPDWGGLQGTAEGSRGRTWQHIARRVEADPRKSFAITMCEMPRHGFDSRRLHHSLALLPSVASLAGAGDGRESMRKERARKARSFHGLACGEPRSAFGSRRLHWNKVRLTSC